MTTPAGRRAQTGRAALITIVALVVLALIAGLWIVLGPGPMDFASGKRVALAAYTAGNPTGVPAELADTSLIQRGEYLARAADCEACHTTVGGKPFAGGRAFVLPFGTLYATNITPDPETGIGRYSDADFLRSVHQGVRPDGSHLYPAMPYASYTYMTDADALAIKAYLFSIAPVHAATPLNTLSFPFNQRWLMGIWSSLFNPNQRFEPNSTQSVEWNRGAYLTEAMEHCGECHTPRNLFQALNNRRKFAGETQAGWRAYNVTSDRETGIGSWSAEEVAEYLKTAHANGRGTASGPMLEAVEYSLSRLTPGDITAIVAYMRTVPAVRTSDLPAVKTAPAPASYKEGVTASNPVGQHVFEGACIGCHDWTGLGASSDHATLIGARAVNDPTATNVIQIVLAGVPQHASNATVFMPGFGHSYSDIEVAAVANYVTSRFGAKPSTITPRDVASLRGTASD